MKEKKIIIKNSSEVVRFLVSRRKQLGLTQTDLAIYANLSRQSLSDIERGKSLPSLSNTIELLRLCGIKISLETNE